VETGGQWTGRAKIGSIEVCGRCPRRASEGDQRGAEDSNCSQKHLEAVVIVSDFFI